MSLLRMLRSRLTYANLISSVALFVALGGGAYAISVPRNSVGSKALRAGAVTAPKVKNHSLTAREFKRGQLPALRGARASDLDPAPAPGQVIASTDVRIASRGKVWVLATVRDVFLTCGASACSAHWGIFVDDLPVASTGMQLQAEAEASDGYTFYTLYGITKPLEQGRHVVKLAFTSEGSPQSVGQLGAQLGALALGA
jgi:hypothetical protein